MPTKFGCWVISIATLLVGTLLIFLPCTGPRTRHPLPRLRVLHVSTPHPGVMAEMDNLAQWFSARMELNWQCTSCHLPIETDFSLISREEANRIWDKTTSKLCQEYDVIIVSDTIAQARSFLQNQCSKRMILRITNRYDWQLWDDPLWHTLMNGSIQRPNVWIVPNNYFEIWYARTLRHIWSSQSLDDSRRQVLVLRGLLPSRSIQSIQVKNSTGHECLPLSPSLVNLVDSHHDHFILLPKLTEMTIPHQVLVPRNYCGAQALQNRILIHLPYQSSTMALWENLAQGVVYLLPSQRFYTQEILPQRMCCLWPRDYDRLDPIERETFLEYTDWYHPKYQHLFLNFESWTHLELLIQSLRFNPIVVQKQQEIIRTWMTQEHEHALFKNWERVLFGNNQISQSTTPSREPNGVSNE